MKLKLIALSLVVLGFGSANGASAVDLYSRAVAEYQGQHYAQALSDFQSLKNAYPNNAMVRYYLALCEQSQNQISRAKEDFGWVAQRCPDAALRSKAAMGLQGLSGYKSHVASSSASDNVFLSPAAAAGGRGGATRTASAASSSSDFNPFMATKTAAVAQSTGGKVRKVLEFKTETCPACVAFESTFQSAKTQFRDIDFQQLDAGNPSNMELVQRYKVTGFPTLVYLDASDRVLFERAGAPVGPAFASSLSQFR